MSVRSVGTKAGVAVALLLVMGVAAYADVTINKKDGVKVNDKNQLEVTGQLTDRGWLRNRLFWRVKSDAAGNFSEFKPAETKRSQTNVYTTASEADIYKTTALMKGTVIQVQVKTEPAGSESNIVDFTIP